MKNIYPFLLGTIAMCVSLTSPAQRLYGGFYTAAKLNNIAANCQKLSWAKSIQQTTLEKAKPWLEKSDSELWAMIPGQGTPRTIDVTLNRAAPNPQVYGCLSCGEKIFKFGNYPYLTDVEKSPWKIECPSCHSKFPTNDFEKYYRSGINEEGVFDSSKADKSLLFNSEHPDPADPLHKFGVDDGWGYYTPDGKVYRLVGYYGWKLWRHIVSGLEVLSDAWLYTGDSVYAHKAAILLDRIADVYPTMNWAPYAKKGWYHSDGGAYQGKIEGSIWETSIASSMARSYDKIISGTVGDEQLFAFLKAKSQRYRLPAEKGSRAHWVKNIDNRLLLEILDAVLKEDIRGNQGMHQLSVATAAIALHTPPLTNQWLDWLFEPGGGAIPGLMFTRFDRDGTSDEGAPSYAMLFATEVSKIAELMHGYPEYTRHNILEEFPQFRASFSIPCKMLVAGKSIPNQGDSGATGLVSSSLCNPKFTALGYWLYKDQEMALEAYKANGKSGEGLYAPLYTAQPQVLGEEINKIGRQNGIVAPKSRLLGGYGYAILETGNAANPIGLVINYGRSLYHAHPDQLNFDLFGFGRWLTPDHGYPEYATRWPSNQEWTGTTLSHNLVLVDQKPQRENWTGHTRLFHAAKGISVATIDARRAYPDIDKYERTMFLIGGAGADSNSYVVDLFSVKGGRDHLLSFHGPPGDMTIEGLHLKSRKGTYAGEQVSKGSWAKGFPVGYSHLYDVKKDSMPAGSFTVDWKVDPLYRPDPAYKKGNTHFRFHSVNKVDDAALAKGDPPRNKPGNPETLDYVLLHRRGENLGSDFVNVMEPYQGQPFIRTVRKKLVQQGDLLIIEIDKYNGVKDYIIKNQSGKPVRTKEISFDGDIAYIQTAKNKLKKATLINTASLRFMGFDLKGRPAISGKVVTMSKEVKGDGWILIDRPISDKEDLSGAYIVIKNSTDRDATYPIQRAEAVGNQTKLYCGPIHFIKGYKGNRAVTRKSLVPERYDLGFDYDFEEGDVFEISRSVQLGK